uniref:hypothetical protein n=1 Tax=Algoriphagus sp. TaxID=1872435 RepID=UPI0040484837
MPNTSFISLTLFFRSIPAKRYQFRSWISTETTLVVQGNLDENHQGLYIQLQHDQLNTQLDLGGISPAVVLQFDEQGVFTGASLSLGTSTGSFSLVTQSKSLLILPFDAAFPIGQLTHYKLN